MSSYIEQSSRFRPWGANVLVGLSALVFRSLPPANPMRTHHETPDAPAPNLPLPSTHLVKIFIFIVIPGVHPELHILPTFLRGIWSLSEGAWEENMFVGPPGCQEVLYQNW